MKFNSKKFLTAISMICLIISISGNSFAHSGRTDSNGGHKDNQNKSGLGSYHYHCGGNPAHLHDNGVCPYSSSSSSSSNSSNNKSSTSSSSKENVTTSSTVEPVPQPAPETATATEFTTAPELEPAPVPEPEPTPEPAQASTPAPEPEPTQILNALSVEINEDISSMKVGESIKLTVTIVPENIEDTSIIWSSSDEDIATVSSTGKVVALKEGMVNITATTSNEKIDTIAITVEEVKQENNTMVVPMQSNELNSMSTTNTEESDPASGILGLGLIGGGSYWGYKKYKDKKDKK